MSEGDLTFEEWQIKARSIRVLDGLTIDDMPDAPEWDAWNAGEDPEEFALGIFAENGYAEDGT